MISFRTPQGKDIPLEGKVNEQGQLEVSGEVDGQTKTLRAKLKKGSAGYAVHDEKWEHVDQTGNEIPAGNFDKPVGDDNQQSNEIPQNGGSKGSKGSKGSDVPLVYGRLQFWRPLNEGQATSSSITVSWASVNNSQGYEVRWTTTRDWWDAYPDASAAFETSGKKAFVPSKTSYTIANLPSGTSYYVKVRALGQEGVWADSDYSKRMLLRTKIKLAPPRNLVAEAGRNRPRPVKGVDRDYVSRSDTQIDLYWDVVEDVGYYEVRWGTDRNNLAKSSGAIDRRRYATDGRVYWYTGGLDSNKTYYFQVKSVSRGSYRGQYDLEDSDYSAIASHTTTQPLSVPGNLQVIGRSYDSITLSWTSVADTGQYEVRAQNFPAEIATFPPPFPPLGTVLTYTIAGLNPGELYWDIKVKALTQDNSRFSDGEYSDAVEKWWTLGKPLPVPSLSAEQGGKGGRSIKVQWDKVPHAYGYRLWWGTQPQGTPVGTFKYDKYRYSGFSGRQTFDYTIRKLDAPDPGSATTYHIKIQALGERTHADSAYSQAQVLVVHNLTTDDDS